VHPYDLFHLSQEGNSALTMALGEDKVSIELVKLLLYHKADASVSGTVPGFCTALLHACTPMQITVLASDAVLLSPPHASYESYLTSLFVMQFGQTVVFAVEAGASTETIQHLLDSRAEADFRAIDEVPHLRFNRELWLWCMHTRKYTQSIIVHFTAVLLLRSPVCYK
jgi:hypothetical protein